MPRERMKRARREPSACSLVGRQTISPCPVWVMNSLPTGQSTRWRATRPTGGPGRSGLRGELHQQPRDRDESAADGIGGEPEAFEGVGAKERRGLQPGEYDERDHRTTAHPNPAVADVVLADLDLHQERAHGPRLLAGFTQSNVLASIRPTCCSIDGRL